MSFFRSISLLQEDPILSIPAHFAEDTHLEKVNLGIGVYRSSEGRPFVLNCVHKAEQLLLRQHLSKDYSPICGDPRFTQAASQLLLGSEFSTHSPSSILCAQTVGGSGALRVGASFLSMHLHHTIFISKPSWPNHQLIFEQAGLRVSEYPYFNPVDCSIDFSNMCAAIRQMPPLSAILLQGCCHNPTGVDLTIDQWKELSDLIKKQKIIPFFDVAYHGFGRDLEKDVEGVHFFAENGHEMLIANSLSKNFGLYGERVGCLTFLSPHHEVLPKIDSQIKRLIRGNYSTPPIHGAHLVTTILESPELSAEWQLELSTMRERIIEMRRAFSASLLVYGMETAAERVTHQRGLFSFIGISPEQVKELRQQRGLYLPPDGRISISGLTATNIDYVSQSISRILTRA